MPYTTATISHDQAVKDLNDALKQLFDLKSLHDNLQGHYADAMFNSLKQSAEIELLHRELSKAQSKDAELYAAFRGIWKD